MRTPSSIPDRDARTLARTTMMQADGAIAEMFVDQTTANLKIIGMLPKNSKLCVRHGQLSIDRDDHLQPVRRWMSRDSRDVTLMHIRNTLTNALRILNGLISRVSDDVVPSASALPLQLPPPTSCYSRSQQSDGDGTVDLAQRQLRMWSLQQVLTEMRGCESGLQNLRTTYVDDSMTVAAIDVLVDRLRANCSAFQARVTALAPAPPPPPPPPPPPAPISTAAGDRAAGTTGGGKAPAPLSVSSSPPPPSSTASQPRR